MGFVVRQHPPNHRAMGRHRREADCLPTITTRKDHNDKMKTIHRFSVEITVEDDPEGKETKQQLVKQLVGGFTNFDVQWEDSWEVHQDGTFGPNAEHRETTK